MTSESLQRYVISTRLRTWGEHGLVFRASSAVVPERPAALRPGLGRAADELLMRSLAVDPSGRFESPAAMSEAAEAAGEFVSDPASAVLDLGGVGSGQGAEAVELPSSSAGVARST